MLECLLCFSYGGDTGVTNISHAPLMRDRQWDSLALGVLEAIPMRNSQPSMCARQRPAVLCLARSNFRRSISSSNASKDGFGDIYIGAISFFVVRNSDTRSDTMDAFVRAVMPWKSLASAVVEICGPSCVSGG